MEGWCQPPFIVPVALLAVSLMCLTFVFSFNLQRLLGRYPNHHSTNSKWKLRKIKHLAVSSLVLSQGLSTGVPDAWKGITGQFICSNVSHVSWRKCDERLTLTTSTTWIWEMKMSCRDETEKCSASPEMWQWLMVLRSHGPDARLEF